MNAVPVWIQEAERRFSGITADIELDDSPLTVPFAIWGRLLGMLHLGYLTQDEPTIREVYGFYRWCDAFLQSHPDGTLDTLGEAMATMFLEDLCQNQLAMQDLPRWFSREEVAEEKEFFAFDHTFKSALDESMFAKIMKAFDRAESETGGCSSSDA